MARRRAPCRHAFTPGSHSSKRQASTSFRTFSVPAGRPRKLFAPRSSRVSDRRSTSPWSAVCSRSGICSGRLEAVAALDPFCGICKPRRANASTLSRDSGRACTSLSFKRRHVRMDGTTCVSSWVAWSKSAGRYTSFSSNCPTPASTSRCCLRPPGLPARPGLARTLAWRGRLLSGHAQGRLQSSRH